MWIDLSRDCKSGKYIVAQCSFHLLELSNVIYYPRSYLLAVNLIKLVIAIDMKRSCVLNIPESHTIIFELLTTPHLRSIFRSILYMGRQTNTLGPRMRFAQESVRQKLDI